MQEEPGNGEQAGWKSWLWMILCCVPMVAIVVLVLLGVLSLT